MTGVYLFDLAGQHARYLATRQSTIAANVANANTPDYKARDAAPFAQVMARVGLQMSSMASAHVMAEESAIPVETSKDGWDVLETASSVSLEQEMLKASDVSREHTLNTGVVKAFHRMLTLAARSGG